MRNIVPFVLSIFIVSACQNTSSQDIDEEIDEALKDETGKEQVATKEEVLLAIESFKESMYELGASEGESVERNSARYSEDSYAIHSKDELISSGIGTHDEEWLEMTVLVLNVAEELTNSSYELGDESLFHDVLDDPSIWGWGVYENTKVILSYIDETLYLRVTDDRLTQTFFFEYVEDDLIKIFRLYESANSDGNSLYIEDFVEKTGLILWWDNEKYYSTVTFDDGFTCTTSTDHFGSKRFISASHVLDGVPVDMSEKNGALEVRYDFNYVDVFDSFDESGQLFLNEETVVMPLEMKFLRYTRNNKDVFALVGSKALNEQANESLEVLEANITSDLTHESIYNKISEAFQHPVTDGLSYDYSQGKDAVIDDLSELLFLEY